jgi:hypothetical protein
MISCLPAALCSFAMIVALLVALLVPILWLVAITGDTIDAFDSTPSKDMMTLICDFSMLASSHHKENHIK